ncbi:sulfate permease [Caldilinea sp.]|jgi:SulP family sulfate permease|nr:sulfate permease [Caldilinea sp.]GIV71394.1 MAG: sulfate transporter [Caldilinea sp.]
MATVQLEAGQRVRPSSTLPYEPLLATGRFVLVAFARPIAILRSYQRSDLRPDLIAGLTVAVILLPQAIAYALIADLPPVVGLYTAIVAAIVGALWGSSAHLHTGPTNAASLLVLSTLAVLPYGHDSHAYVAAASLMALMVGLFRLAMGVFRLGVLVNFVSDSVVVGFTAGAGVLIMFNQIKHLLRLDVPNSPGLMDTLRDTLAQLPAAHAPTMMVGVGVIVLLAALRRLRPSWPGPLIGVVVAGAVVWLLQLDMQGVHVIGALPRGLPPLAPPPIFDLHLIGQLSLGALAVAAIGLVEAMSIARAISGLTGQRINSNQEFVGQGLANIAAGFFSGYTCSGSFTRSAVNYRAGARTAMSSVFSGVFVLLAMFLFAPLAAYIPRTALAAVLIVIAWGMIDRKQMAHIWRTSRPEGWIMIATLGATLLLPLEFAVLTGILVSLAYYVLQKSMPRVLDMTPTPDFLHFEERGDRDPCPQLGVLSIVGDLYFGAAPNVEEALRRHMATFPDQRYLLLRMHNVTHLDISGLHMLEAIVRAYRERGGDVYVMKVRASIYEFMKLAGFVDLLGEDHFLSEEKAISHLFYHVLDPVVCIYECPVRVFFECQNLPKMLTPALACRDSRCRDRTVRSLSPMDLWLLLHRPQPPVVIDVREPREFSRGHIPGARLIPLSQFDAQRLNLDKETPIVLACRTGRRSRIAAQMAMAAGYQNVCNMEGGMVAWEAAGLLEAIEEFV